MYTLRIHSVDTLHSTSTTAAADAAPEATPSSSSSSSTPKLPPPPPPAAASTPARSHALKTVESNGIIHLYRKFSTTTTSADPHPLLPTCRGTRLYVVAVPSSLSVEDFLRFCGSHHTERFLEVRVVRNDGVEDRYSVLILLTDQKSADSFYLSVNGWRFPSQEEEICHIFFTASVEYTEFMEVAGSIPAGYTELPTCPVCLERLDQDTSGIATTDCDHSFRCSCVPKWANSLCPVCRFCQEHSDKPMCSACGTTEGIWICMICGFIGCGRYKERHAINHWKDSQHCYSLDLGTQIIWDYVGDTHVHRLNPSTSDRNLVKSKHGCESADGTCGACECSEDSGIGGALFSSKVEAVIFQAQIKDEYNLLLDSQLESQRQYYESLILETRAKQEKLISEAVEKALHEKLQNTQLEIEKVIREKKTIDDMNEKLMKDQKIWQDKLKEIEERGKATLQLKYEKIRDLQEQIRDFTFYIQAQKTIGNGADADDIKQGTVLPLPPQQPSSTSGRKTSKINRRRH